MYSSSYQQQRIQISEEGPLPISQLLRSCRWAEKASARALLQSSAREVFYIRFFSKNLMWAFLASVVRASFRAPRFRLRVSNFSLVCFFWRLHFRFSWRFEAIFFVWTVNVTLLTSSRSGCMFGAWRAEALNYKSVTFSGCCRRSFRAPRL